jgi:hypothetical protein
VFIGETTASTPLFPRTKKPSAAATYSRRPLRKIGVPNEPASAPDAPNCEPVDMEIDDGLSTPAKTDEKKTNKKGKAARPKDSDDDDVIPGTPPTPSPQPSARKTRAQRACRK